MSITLLDKATTNADLLFNPINNIVTQLTIEGFTFQLYITKLAQQL